LATGVCDGLLWLWSPGVDKKRGVVGCEDKWKVGCVEIKKEN